MSALDLIQGILDRVQDEGDRVYLGSTNDVELLRHVITVLDADRPLPDHPPTFGGDDEAVARIVDPEAFKIPDSLQEFNGAPKARAMTKARLILARPQPDVEAAARVSETKAEKIARLQREIGERQMALQYLVLGDPSQGVSVGGQPDGRTG